MKTKKLTITEKNFDLMASKNMIFNAIESQINNYEVQFLKDWERDHSISPLEKNEKIKMLKAEKQEIMGLYKALDEHLAQADVKISIDLTVKEDTSVLA